LAQRATQARHQPEAWGRQAHRQQPSLVDFRQPAPRHMSRARPFRAATAARCWSLCRSSLRGSNSAPSRRSERVLLELWRRYSGGWCGGRLRLRSVVDRPVWQYTAATRPRGSNLLRSERVQRALDIGNARAEALDRLTNEKALAHAAGGRSDTVTGGSALADRAARTARPSRISSSATCERERSSLAAKRSKASRRSKLIALSPPLATPPIWRPSPSAA
jgi:hypothetical protein